MDNTKPYVLRMFEDQEFKRLGCMIQCTSLTRAQTLAASFFKADEDLQSYKITNENSGLEISEVRK